MAIIDRVPDDAPQKPRLDGPATGTAGYGCQGQADGDAPVLTVSAGAVEFGAGKTIRRDTDLNRVTGHQIRGSEGDDEYNAKIGADGRAALYSGGAGEVLVGEFDYAYSADGRTIELAVDRALPGGIARLRDLAAANDTITLPNDYPNIDVFAPSPAACRRRPGPADRDRQFPDRRGQLLVPLARGQLVMSAQNQAMQAGIPFDLPSETDLKDTAGVAAYDIPVFPGFFHVKAADLAENATPPKSAQAPYGTGFLVAGSFLTDDETGAALPRDSDALMKSLLGVTPQGPGPTVGVLLRACDAAHPILEGGTAGATVAP